VIARAGPIKPTFTAMQRLLIDEVVRNSSTELCDPPRCDMNRPNRSRRRGIVE
jgi:hypothetical protein